MVLAPLAGALTINLGQVALFYMKTQGEVDFGTWAREQEWSLTRFFAIVIPLHATILGVTVLATARSRRPFRERLGLVRPPLPYPGRLGGSFLFGHASAAVAMAFAFLAGALYMSVFGQASPEMVELHEMLGSQTGLAGLAVLLAVAVVPAFSEELLYRGFAQTRLTERFGPVAAIVICGAFFAITHQEPMQVFVVFPVGLVFGFIRWRSGSIWPAMIAHALYNSSVMGLMRIGKNDSTSSLAVLLFVFIGGLAITPLALKLLREIPRSLSGGRVGSIAAVGQDLSGDGALEESTAANHGQSPEEQ